MDPFLSALAFEGLKAVIQQVFIFARQAGMTREDIDAEWARSKEAADARPASALTPPPAAPPETPETPETA